MFSELPDHDDASVQLLMGGGVPPPQQSRSSGGGAGVEQGGSVLTGVVDEVEESELNVAKRMSVSDVFKKMVAPAAPTGFSKSSSPLSQVTASPVEDPAPDEQTVMVSSCSRGRAGAGPILVPGKGPVGARGGVVGRAPRGSSTRTAGEPALLNFKPFFPRTTMDSRRSVPVAKIATTSDLCTTEQQTGAGVSPAVLQYRGLSVPKANFAAPKMEFSSAMPKLLNARPPPVSGRSSSNFTSAKPGTCRWASLPPSRGRVGGFFF